MRVCVYVCMRENICVSVCVCVCVCWCVSVYVCVCVSMCVCVCAGVWVCMCVCEYVCVWCSDSTWAKKDDLPWPKDLLQLQQPTNLYGTIELIVGSWFIKLNVTRTVLLWEAHSWECHQQSAKSETRWKQISTDTGTSTKYRYIKKVRNLKNTWKQISTNTHLSTKFWIQEFEFKKSRSGIDW